MAEATVCSGDEGKEEECKASTESVESSSLRQLCEHYSRGCSFISPCCGKEYPCRLCHDENESHKIDRHSISEIKCRKCFYEQPVANYCCKCGLQFGLYYFCAICNFYDDVNKGQFHCEKCGICRARGKENFFHCDKCGFCLALGKKENHTCRENSSKNNCPICMEDIHTSRDPAHVPRCGHVLHSTCFKGLMEKGLYKCPQCQISLIDMHQYWERMDTEREAWIMPQQLREFKVKIHCRDCGHEGDTGYHVAGLKCTECGSYNTVRCGSEELPLVATDFLHRYQHQRQRGSSNGRPEWRRPRSRRSRHREEREMLLLQLEAMEQRALTADEKLADCQRQLQQSNRKEQQQTFLLQQAQQNATQAEEKALLAEQRTEVAEDKALELERRLFEAEADLEEMAEYRDLLVEFQEFSLQQQQQQQQQHHSSQPELSSAEDGVLCSKESGGSQQQQKRDVLLNLLRQLPLQNYRSAATPSVAEEERHSQCSDQISITSL